jgi:hypothetical protein
MYTREYNGVAVGGGIYVYEKEKEMEVKTPACHYTHNMAGAYTQCTHSTHAYNTHWKMEGEVRGGG